MTSLKKIGKFSPQKLIYIEKKCHEYNWLKQLHKVTGWDEKYNGQWGQCASRVVINKKVHWYVFAESVLYGVFLPRVVASFEISTRQAVVKLSYEDL